MLKTLIEKELRAQLFTPRMAITTTVIVLIMLVNGLIFNLRFNQGMTKTNRETAATTQGLQENASSLMSLLFYEQTLIKQPSPLGFIANGNEDVLPNGTKMNYFTESPLGHFKSQNRFFSRFQALDWTFLLVYVLSFVCLAFSYNAFSGEKEQGTLKLILSNNLPRGTLILGKLFGLMICVALPFLLGLLLNLLIVEFNPHLVLQTREWLILLAFTGVAMLFIAMNLLLGLLVSSLTARASHSLNLLLMSWILLAVIIPGISWVSARKMVPVPSEKVMRERYNRDVEQIYENGDYSWSWRSSWAGQPPNETVRRRAAGIQATDAHRIQFYRAYQAQRFKQTDRAVTLAKLSPFSLFRFIGERFSDNGYLGLKRFVAQARIYRSTVNQFYTDRDNQDTDSHHLLWNEPWASSTFGSQRPVEPASIPRFEYSPPTLSEIWQQSQWDILILFFWCLLLFAGTFTTFIRYDVR